MIYHLLDNYLQSQSDAAGALRALRYITVRSSLALLLGFGLSLLIGERVIEALRRLRVGQFIRRSEGDKAISLFEMHAAKEGTPTMGGILILIATLIPVALLCDWKQPVVGLAVAMALGFSGIGFWDDYLKVVRKNSKGLNARAKLILQVLLGLAFGYLFAFGGFGVRYHLVPGWGSDGVALPFLKQAAFSLGWMYIFYAALVLTATSNAVNLSDGVDGLAIGVSISVALCLGVIAYLVGRTDMAAYLIVPHVPGAGELAVLMSALVGAGLGFLWFNSHPASVFMGDTGSMMLGGVMGATALLLKQEFLLAIVGGIFVIEALSVIVQVTSFRLFGKRAFRMSPLHHHFERCGWAESKITTRFWILSVLLALVGLSALKLR
jgi:phospho-N-acetylmuramoyl-pentapeptide-transferase